MPAKILVVDDEPDLQLLISQKFRRQIAGGRYQFVFALNGAEALTVLDSHPDTEVLVTDLNMPVMDGLTLLSKLRTRNQTLRAIVLSAYDDLGNIRAAMNLGAYDFLTKPIDFRDFETTLEKTIVEVTALRVGLEARQKLSEIQYELNVATRIQQSILPQTIPGREDFEIGATMAAARQVGGDFYDFFFVDSDRLALAVGDVSGKGIPAALYMAVSRTLVRATGLEGHSPAECLRRVNRVLMRQSEGEMFVTLFYGVLHLKTGELQFGIAGHPPSCYLTGAEPPVLLHKPRGMMLGLTEDVDFSDGVLQMKAGDVLLMYTDGITEAENGSGEFFETRRLTELAAKLRDQAMTDAVTAVLECARDFGAGAELADDMTVMAVRYRPLK